MCRRLLAVLQQSRRLKRLGADRAHWIEGIAGVLRNETDGAPPQRTELPFCQTKDLPAIKLDMPAGASAIRQQPEHRPGNRGLSRARFPDQGQALATSKLKGGVADDPVLSVKNGEIIDLQQGGIWLRVGADEWEGCVQFVLRSHRLILFTERTVAIVTKAGA